MNATSYKYVEITKSGVVAPFFPPQGTGEELSSRGREYNPWECPELVNALAHIEDGEPEKVRAFVQRYGVLGGGDREGMDTLDWFREHAKNVHVIIQARCAHSSMPARSLQEAVATANTHIRNIVQTASICGHTIRLEERSPYLLAVIYCLALDENATFRRCEECGTPYIMTHRRQRFCPKQYGEHESRCGMMYFRRKRTEDRRSTSHSPTDGR